MENQVSLSVLIMNKGQSFHPPISPRQLADTAAQQHRFLSSPSSINFLFSSEHCYVQILLDRYAVVSEPGLEIKST